jgi:hypothetical protein
MNAAAVLGILFLSLSALGVMPESQIVQIANGGGSLRGKLKSESSLRVRRHTGSLHIFDSHHGNWSASVNYFAMHARDCYFAKLIGP